VIKLEENFRSTQPILNLANEVLFRGGANFRETPPVRKESL
jgi:superfamily I DNA/RNA helicase